VDVDAYIGWDLVDDRKIERRPCPQVGGFCGHSRKCRRKIRGDDETGHGGDQAQG
jgi:hypothetical protein